MNSRILHSATQTALLVLLFVWALSVQAQQKLPVVYVWDFTAKDLPEKSDWPEKFTSDFEQALLLSKKYEVVERRRFDKILAHAKNECSIAQLSLSDQEILTNAIRADMVIFGQVYDDKESGEVKVSVTFEDFRGRKKAGDQVLIKRGLVTDASHRMLEMTNLVNKVCGIQPAETVRDSPGIGPNAISSHSEPQTPKPALRLALGNELPALGEFYEIETTAKMRPRNASYFLFDFHVKTKEGDLFKFEVEPANEAAVATSLTVYVEEDLYWESSSPNQKPLRWVMKKPLGRYNNVRVQLRISNAATLKIRVTKAN